MSILLGVSIFLCFLFLVLKRRTYICSIKYNIYSAVTTANALFLVYFIVLDRSFLQMAIVYNKFTTFICKLKETSQSSKISETYVLNND